jgi:hypothetical protein
MVVAPEPEGEPPGSTSQVRTLYELLTTYDRTLSDSTAITADLTPRNWLGPASESYQEKAKNPLEAQLRTVREINAAVMEEVERHQDFRAQLAKLWQDPRERTHMRTVHQHASNQLAARLFAKAAELDRVANFDEVQRAPAGPVVLTVPWPTSGFRRAEKPPAPEPVEEPDGPDPLAALEPRNEGSQEEQGAPDDDSADENGQAASGGNAGHNGHGVLPPGTATAVGARDETERAAWLRAIPLPRMVRTDIIWDGDD